MSYLPDLYAKGVEQGISEEEEIWIYIKSSLVRRNFESLGYKIASFDTGYSWSTIEDVDFTCNGEKMPTACNSSAPLSRC